MAEDNKNPQSPRRLESLDREKERQEIKAREEELKDLRERKIVTNAISKNNNKNEINTDLDINLEFGEDATAEHNNSIDIEENILRDVDPNLLDIGGINLFENPEEINNDTTNPLADAMGEAVANTVNNTEEGTQLTQEEKKGFSDFFSEIAKEVNKFGQNIQKVFKDLSDKIKDSENLTFTDLNKNIDEAVVNAESEVGKSKLSDDIKNKINDAVQGLIQDITKYSQSIKRTEPSNRDKVFSNMIENVKKLFVAIQEVKEPAQQNQNISNPTPQNTTTVTPEQTTSNENNAASTLVNNIISSVVASRAQANSQSNSTVVLDQQGQQQNQNKSIGNSLGTIKEETKEDLQSQENDDTVGQNLSSSISSNEVSSSRLDNSTKNSLLEEGMGQESELTEQSDPKLFDPKVPTKNINEVKQSLKQQQNPQTQPLQPQQQHLNLGDLNSDKVNNLNLAPFSNNQNIQQQYPPSNRELDEIKEKLNNIEKKLNSPHAQQQPAPEEKKSEMSNGMKAGLVACFLLLFLINPALVLAIGAVAAVGAGSFYGGKAIMGKINDSLENRKNEKANNQGLVQQQELSKTPNQTQSQNLSQTPTPPSTPKVNTGQNREIGGVNNL